MNTMIKMINTDNGCSAFTAFNSASIKVFEEAFAQLTSETHAEYKTFEAGKVPFEELPEDVQNEVKSILRAYNEVTVEYEHLKFHVSTGCCIRSSYNFDHCVCGRYFAKDLYTDEERRQNFIEEFGYAPARI